MCQYIYYKKYPAHSSHSCSSLLIHSASLTIGMGVWMHIKYLMLMLPKCLLICFTLTCNGRTVFYFSTWFVKFLFYNYFLMISPGFSFSRIFQSNSWFRCLMMLIFLASFTKISNNFALSRNLICVILIKQIGWTWALFKAILISLVGTFRYRIKLPLRFQFRP